MRIGRLCEISIAGGLEPGRPACFGAETLGPAQPQSKVDKQRMEKYPVRVCS